MRQYQPPSPQRIIDALSDASILLDQELKTMWTDPALPVVLGPQMSQAAVDKSLSEVLPGIRTVIREMIDRDEAYRRNHRLKVDGDAALECELVIVRLNQGDCDVWLVRLHNIHERARSLQAIRLATKFRAISRQYRLSAHDLKRPISTLRLVAQVLRDNLPACDPDGEGEENQWPQIIQYLQEATNDLDQTINSMIGQMTDIDVGDQLFDVNQELASVLQLIEPQARAQEISVSLRTCAERVKLTGSRDLFHQLLSNLAVNALEAVGKGGSIEISCTSDASDVYVTVSDDGPGMNEELARRCFDLHYTTKAAGHGVGLAGVQQIVEAFGGSIYFETEENAGVQFTVKLPRHEAFNQNTVLPLS